MSAPDRRALILEAAREAFAEGGYHETSLDGVAERAGVSKALLYEHFDSKRELYAAMLEIHVTELVDRINAALVDAEPGGGPAARRPRGLLRLRRGAPGRRRRSCCATPATPTSPSGSPASATASRRRSSP